MKSASMKNWLKSHAVRHPLVFPDLLSEPIKKGKNWNACRPMLKKGSLALRTLVWTFPWTAMSPTIVDSSVQTPVIINRTRFPVMVLKYLNAFLFRMLRSPCSLSQEQLMQRLILLLVVKLDTEGTCQLRGASKAWIRIGVGNGSSRSRVRWVAKRVSHASTRMSRKRLALSETTSLLLQTRGSVRACSRIEWVVLVSIMAADVTATPQLIDTPCVKALKAITRWHLNRFAGLLTKIHKQKGQWHQRYLGTRNAPASRKLPSSAYSNSC